MRTMTLLPILLASILSTVFVPPASAQDALEVLALQVSKADAANAEKLQAYSWRRQSDTFVSDVLKATVVMECKFDSAGKLVVTPLDAKTTVQQQRGLRGRAQQSAMEDNMEYVEQALDRSVAYLYMTKGQLIDFFGKSRLTKLENGTLVITGKDVYVAGDQLIVHVDPVTHLFIYKGFATSLGADQISGAAYYEKFASSGVNHVTGTTLLLPSKGAKIVAVNKEYSLRLN
jgi:hypothetical protein